MAPALLAFLVALAPAAPAQALLSKSPPIQVQKPQVQTKSKQPLALAPKITTVTPQTCVKAGQGTKLGDKVTLDGSNFGFPKPAGYTLVVQPAGSLTRTPVPVTSWTATSITFNVPSGLAAESNFTVGILSGTSFFSPTQLTVCARIQLKRVPGVMPARETSSPDVVLRARSPYIRQFEAVNPPSDPGGGPPEITSVSPADCVKVGSTATAHGVNLGPTKLAAGFSLGYQAVYEPPTVEINESTWSPTSVSFTVPPGAGVGGWFALGIIFESEFYAQQFVSICGAYTGQGGGYYGGGYDGGDYDYQDSGDGYVAGPKGARRLGPGGRRRPDPAVPRSGRTSPGTAAAAGKARRRRQAARNESARQQGSAQGEQGVRPGRPSLPVLQERRLGVPGEGARQRRRDLNLGGILENRGEDGGRTSRL